MKPFPPQIAELRAAWKASGLRQPAFAQRCGVSYAAMIQLLTNGTYSLTVLNKARAAVWLPPFAWPTTTNLPPGFKYGVGVHAGQEMKNGPTSCVPAVIVRPVEPTMASGPCAVCRTATSRSYGSASGREFLCSPECIELRAEMVSATRPAVPVDILNNAEHRKILDAQLARAQVAVTAARGTMAHTPLERRLTQALTLISGVRFDLTQS